MVHGAVGVAPWYLDSHVLVAVAVACILVLLAVCVAVAYTCRRTAPAPTPIKVSYFCSVLSDKYAIKMSAINLH